MAENAAALRRGELDVVQLFQPFAEELIAAGEGHLWYAAATRGPTSYTSLYARRGTPHRTARRAEEDGARALPHAEMAARQPAPKRWPTPWSLSFPAVAPPLLRAAVARYHALAIWGHNPILPRAGYERLQGRPRFLRFCRICRPVRAGGRQQCRRGNRPRRPAAAGRHGDLIRLEVLLDLCDVARLRKRKHQQNACLLRAEILAGDDSAFAQAAARGNAAAWPGCIARRRPRPLAARSKAAR